MSTPILATKLYIPPLQPKIVLRPRLIEHLNEGLHRKLTLISAPAGFGKTTLISEWLTGCDSQAAWLSLDEDDSDLTRFLTYLITTLQTLASSPALSEDEEESEKSAANIGEGLLDVLNSPQHPPIESILTILLNELTTVPDRCILVLDDYHSIDSKSVDRALTFLLDHLPPQMHLVIASREDPNLPLAKLRAQGQLTELRAGALRFTPAEAAGFLNQALGFNLPAEEISALESLTEGWIAGLQLAAISMQGQQDVTGFIQSFTGSHNFVMDYLVEEVLKQQSQNVQKFLLHTSILDRLCGSLCDALMQDPSISGQDTLEYIERANLFIVPLDNERCWYRYHHLFADLLRQRLQQNAASSTKNTTENINELHIRASRWYEEHDLNVEALHHAFAADDFERAADLVELSWAAMDQSFQSATWLAWVKELPEDLIHVRPVLCIGYAWALLDVGELEVGEIRLRDAERWLDRLADVNERLEPQTTRPIVVDEEQFRLLPATIATARGYLASASGDIPGAVTYAQQALDLLPEEDYLRRGTTSALLGIAYWASGDLEAAEQTFADSMANMKMAGNMLFATSVTLVLAEILVKQGHLHEAVRMYESSLLFVKGENELVQLLAPSIHLGLSMLHLEQGDLEVASQHLLESKKQGEHAALQDWQYRWFLTQARMKEIQGKLDEALHLLYEAEQFYFRGPMPDMRPVTALKARVWIKQGRLAQALDWMREQNLSVDDDLSYQREFDHITLARLQIARYKSHKRDRSLLEAMTLLERLLKAAEDGGRTNSTIEILVLQALAHKAQGNMPLAFESLEHALNLAEPEGYIRIFADEGDSMRTLISDCRLWFEKHSRSQSYTLIRYIDRLLAAFVQQTGIPQPTIKNQTSTILEPLSERELEILQLIAQGLSNREIGERLFLALSTVKGHNQKIFGKLQVQRRTEAVARARESGLL